MRKKRTFETTTFTLSHSGLSIIEKCPRKWYHRYIEEKYITEPQPWNDFGLLNHRVAEFYNGEGLNSIKELAKKISLEEDLKIHNDYKHKIKTSLKNIDLFYKHYLKVSIKPLREKEYRIPLNEYVDLSGSFDVIYKNKNNELVITDYKTCKNKGEHSRQLALYFYILKEKFGDNVPNVVKGQIVYLSLDDLSNDINSIVDEYYLDYDDIRSSERRIQSALDIISHCNTKEEMWRKKPCALCNYCEFKKHDICDAKT